MYVNLWDVTKFVNLSTKSASHAWTADVQKLTMCWSISKNWVGYKQLKQFISYHLMATANDTGSTSKQANRCHQHTVES